MLKAIIFDFDGTIVNSLPYYIQAYDLTYRTFGFKLSKKHIIQTIIDNETEEFENYIDKLPDFIGEISSQFTEGV